jgi:hypothetical protein
MTNLQLLLTIGIPSLLVVLSWLSNNARFAAIEKRIEALELKTDRKFEQIDRKFEEIEQRFERRFQDVITAQHKDALVILQSMTSLHERVAVVEAKQALAA